MQKNDYRRALIVLRAMTRRSLTGHVRLERRTLMGSLRITINGSDAREKLHALIMAQQGNRWVGHRLGMLNQDNRGQAGLNVTFDPRNIDGRDLNDYALIVLVGSGDGTPEMVMSGNVNGSRDIQWDRVREAALSGFRPNANVAQWEQNEVTEIVEQNAEEEVFIEETDEIEDGIYVENDVTIEEETVVFSDTLSVSESEENDSAVDAEPMPGCAYQALELDASFVWQDEVAALRTLFESAKISDRFARAGFVFINSALNCPGEAVAACAIGLRTQVGQITDVCYAIPGDYAIEPPPGLESYTYENGHWVLELCLNEMP